MNKWDGNGDDLSGLPGGADPLALLEEGMRRGGVGRRTGWEALSVEEVGAMLPAYEVRRLVGSGGMGAVYEAVQRDLRRRVAIKLLAPGLAEKPGLAVRFRYESRLMASLEHPGVVRVHEAGETPEGHLYYVMEYVDGEDLASRMGRGRLSVDEAVGLIGGVADALGAAHRLRIVHRDVKPGNILLSAGGQVLLGDFGLALTAEQAGDPLRLTRAGTTVGTLEYAAPEQLSRVQSVTPASDVYSLGVLTYEVLTGELPRGNFDPPSVRNAAVDAAFDGVVMHALQSDPGRRFGDALEFRAAFLHAADRRRQQELRDRALRGKMVRRAWMVVALAAVAAVTGGSALAAWRARREAEERRMAAESAEQRMAGLFQFLLTDLRQRLEPTGNLGAMDAVMEKAVEHFRREYESAGRSPEAALKLAEVLVTKAHVIGMRGREDTAEELHSEALALCQGALERDPGNGGYALRVFQALRDRAAHRRTWNNHAGAMEDAVVMERAAVDLVRRFPGPSSQYAEVEACIAMAASHGQDGRLEEAHGYFGRARILLEALASGAPAEREYADKLAELDTALGSNAEARGDYDGMLRHFTAWHDFVVRTQGRESDLYSSAAFRMGVALQKLGRPEEALTYLKTAVRLGERQIARLPGHKGFLNHLSWCLKVSAQCQDDLGRTEESAVLRRREAEVNAQKTAPPEVAAVPLETQYAQLAGDATVGRERWWKFCQDVQRAAESLSNPDAVRVFYEGWLERAGEGGNGGGSRESGDLIQLVPAFLQNRLATLWLEEKPDRSLMYAKQALALRMAVAAAHPDDSELSRDVLSSACHAADAAVRLDSVAEAEAFLTKVAEACRGLPGDMLTPGGLGLFYAERGVLLLEFAAARWPGNGEAFHRLGGEIAAALLDRLPPAQAGEAKVEEFRRRLTGVGVTGDKAQDHR